MIQQLTADPATIRIALTVSRAWKLALFRTQSQKQEMSNQSGWFHTLVACLRQRRATKSDLYDLQQTIEALPLLHDDVGSRATTFKYAFALRRAKSFLPLTARHYYRTRRLRDFCLLSTKAP